MSDQDRIHRLVHADGWFVDVPIQETGWLLPQSMQFRVENSEEETVTTEEYPHLEMNGTVIHTSGGHSIISCGGLLASLPWAPNQGQEEGQVRITLQNQRVRNSRRQSRRV